MAELDSKMELTLDQRRVWKELTETRSNLFVTGGAGTGKSFLIQQFLRQAKEKIPVLASTGAAAILVGGRTFHSFFGLGIMNGGAAAAFDKATRDRQVKKRVKDASTLVIDEISMIPFEALDCAEQIARAVRACDEPWGGLRIVAVGDFFQLPPVSREKQKPWAFLGEAWANSSFKRMELWQCLRTQDDIFLRILNQIRLGRVSGEVEDFLNERMTENFDQDISHLFPRRDQTESFNQERLAELPGMTKEFETLYSGESSAVDRLRRDAPVPEVLQLKKGARVMIRINDPRQRFVNGSMGTIQKILDGALQIDLGYRTIELEPFAFTWLNEMGEEVAVAKNFPVNLAYASTIHKIQGATLDGIRVNLKSLWEPGQAYVALSRARKGEHISIMDWDKRSIRVDGDVQRFSEV